MAQSARSYQPRVATPPRVGRRTPVDRTKLLLVQSVVTGMKQKREILEQVLWSIEKLPSYAPAEAVELLDALRGMAVIYERAEQYFGKPRELRSEKDNAAHLGAVITAERVLGYYQDQLAAALGLDARAGELIEVSPDG